MTPQVALRLADATDVAEARRRAARLAPGADEASAGAVALVVTELATNLLKHAGGGELLMRAVAGGVQLLALDAGRGIADVERSLRDGYSTAGSPGTGLGAVRRLSQCFDIYSRPGRGTAIAVQVPIRPGVARAPAWDVGAVSVPRPGEDVCGDDWAVCESDDALTVLVVDGLGHGLGAADAAHAAVAAFRRHAGLELAPLFDRLHSALRPTRGAAIGVARLDRRRDAFAFCGVGNIAGVAFGDGTSRHVVSHPGIVGHEVRKVAEFTYPWSAGTVLVLHSDGLRSPGPVAEHYPGLLARHPDVVAGVLYRDLRRERDDATVLIARPGRESRP